LCSARRCRAYHGFADEIDTVDPVATLQQGDQIAPRAAADEEDLVGPLQEALVKGLSQSKRLASDGSSLLGKRRHSSVIAAWRSA